MATLEGDRQQPKRQITPGRLLRLKRMWSYLDSQKEDKGEESSGTEIARMLIEDLQMVMAGRNLRMGSMEYLEIAKAAQEVPEAATQAGLQQNSMPLEERRILRAGPMSLHYDTRQLESPYIHPLLST